MSQDPPSTTAGAEVLTVEQAAGLLRCQPKTVEEMLRTGKLAGLKAGVGWILPRGAFMRSLDRLAEAEAEARRNDTPKPTAIAAPAEAVRPAKRGRARPLPKLVDMRSGA